jgi:hypothetical protein
MASEIRVNQIQSRTGLSTVTFSDTGIVVGNKISVGSAFIQNNAIGIGTTTTAGRNAGVGTAVGTLVYNETLSVLEIYKRNQGWVAIGTAGDSSGIGPPLGLTATGGVISDYTDSGPGAVYRAHIFTSTGTFTVSALSPSLPNNVEYLVVAGGGGGGGDAGGGGGAGGLRSNHPGMPAPLIISSSLPVTTSPGSYTITVGAGGNGAPSSSSNASAGGFSPDWWIWWIWWRKSRRRWSISSGRWNGKFSNIITITGKSWWICCI